MDVQTILCGNDVFRHDINKEGELWEKIENYLFPQFGESKNIIKRKYEQLQTLECLSLEIRDPQKEEIIIYYKV